MTIIKFYKSQRFCLRIYFFALVVAASLSFSFTAFGKSRPISNKENLVLLCVSAHPDDEDGATLAYYARIKNVEAYSVFYTRGEGGQNVIGPELYDELGEMRTEETLAASSILGTQVYFLNFPDFGFSKTAKETFRLWGGKDTVLAQIVYMIRALKPDVIITHHDTITTLPYRQHGNHQAVGITIYEAFDKAADPSYHPEQFRFGVTPWQVKKLYFRVLRQSELPQAGEQDSLVSIPVEAKYGSESIRQIALDALKKHRTQGMNNLDFTKLPGVFKQPVYQLIRCDKRYPYDPRDLFSGIEPSVRKTSPIPKIYTADLRPFSIYVSPK
ncbi:MAG: PIG-L family deacetylase [Candidatus Kryptoniota bacterium]